MAIDEKIQESLGKLPDDQKAEVLDFVEYLLLKKERETMRLDEADWSSLSLTFAMRGTEDETVPEYTLADLKETFA
jgi:hypothetical protein